MPIKNNLKDFRSKFNINQQEFGACIGVSRQTIRSDLTT